MALNLVFRYQIRTATGGIGVGQYINTYWNDSTEALEVYEYDDASDTTGTLMTSGPDIGARRIDHEVYNYAGRESGYSIYNFCDASDLNSFRTKSNFPYAELVIQVDHASCSLNVCDLTISDYSTTPASDQVTADGTITVIASSSYGPIKYALDDPEFDYATEGQSSNQFLGLLAATYTVYAKDSRGCFDSIEIILGVPVFYGPKFRLDYPDRNGIPTRIDILERGFEGDVEIVKGGSSDPFVLRYNGQDINKFKPVIASEARLTILNTEAQGNFYYLDLFTQDERKYQMRYYKDFGNTLPAFTPAAMDALGSWLETSDGESWSGLSISMAGSKTSNKKYTLYAFEAGQTYSFDYDFSSTGATNGLREFRIEITNAAGADLGKNISINVNSGGNFTGNHTFIAPVGADRIRIYVVQSSPNCTYTINDFDNVTESTAGGDVGLELKWIGYLISANYQEVYGPTPYPVTIVATDGLADLKKEKFLDSAGNKFRGDIITMKAITEILNKTDLGINIITAVNRLEAEMTSNALTESKFDADTFYADDEERTPENCFYALEHIVKIFGCRIYQRSGKWMIQTIEEAAHSFEYQEFNREGILLDEGTISDFLEVEKRLIAMEAAFRDRDQILEVIPAYGLLFFEHTLLERPSLVKSYSFEQEDVYETPEGKAAFTNWNVNVSDAPGSDFGIKETNAFEGKFNFYYKVQRTDQDAAGESITVTASEGTIEYSNQDAFEWKFDYSVILSPDSLTRIGTPYPSRAPLWVKLKWMLKVGDYYFNEAIGWTDNEANKYNEIYVDAYNDQQEYKIVAPMRDVGEDPVTESFNVEFVMANEKKVDFESNNFSVSHAPLTSIATVDLVPGTRVKGKIIDGSAFNFYYYELSQEDSANDGDDIIRPDDYNGTTNQKVWVLQDQYAIRRRSHRADAFIPLPVPESRVNYWYMDNVVLRLLPNGSEPVVNITIERTNNVNIKIDYEDQFILNDIDIDNINNSERTYKNFFKRLDGTPTEFWTRTYRDGTGKLLDLYSNDYTSQYKNPGFKMTGSLLVEQEITYGTILRELFDNGRMFMFMGFELRDRSYSVGFDISELKDVVNDPDSDDIDAGFTTGWTLGFRA